MEKKITSIFSNYNKGNEFVCQSDSHFIVKTLDKNFIPENLSWQLNLTDKKFKFIGKTEVFGIYAHLLNITFNDFIKLTKKPFDITQLDLINYIINLYPRHYDSEKNLLQIELLIPLKLTSDTYYVKQIITPLRSNKGIHGIQFVNIPIKKFNNDPLHFDVLFNYSRNECVKNKLVQDLSIRKLFTRQQISNIYHIHNKLTSSDIATLENKSKAAIYKLNRKILEKISIYLDIEFKTVAEAVQFFFECFPQYHNKLRS